MDGVSSPVAGAMATVAQVLNEVDIQPVVFKITSKSINNGVMATTPQVLNEVNLQSVVLKTVTKGVNTGAMTTAPQALNGVNIQPAVFKAVEETSARSLLGKVAALGRSAWALAVAHPVITTMAVVAAIAIPTLIIAWRKNKEKNVIMPRSNEVPQSNEIAQSDKSSGVP